MKNSIFSKAITILGAIAMLVGVAACGQSNDSTKATTDGNGLKKVTFMLSWAPDTNHIGVYVAKNKGYFKQAGLDVDIVAVAQAGAEQAVNNGMADFALSNLTNVGTYTLKGAKIKQVLQVQQKPSAIWCSLASNTSIKSPKDFDGKTFATFGSNESDAVIRRMIQTDGGKGTFDKVTVGTSTFQTLSSKKADFGGFYATWEGVQADMYGPKLNCFTEPDYGVPGNADTIGVITSDKTISSNPDLVKKFAKYPSPAFDRARAYAQAAEAAAAGERMIEVNTSGAYYACKEPFPHIDLLTEFRKAGVPVTLGTDAHEPRNVDRGIDAGLKLLYEAGYREITALLPGGERRAIPLS